jgi:hypothetical protein
MVSYHQLVREANKTRLHLDSTVVHYRRFLRINTLEKVDEPAPELPPYLDRFQEVFDTRNADKLPAYREDTAMDIEMLPGTEQPKGRIYQLSRTEEEALRKEVEIGLKSGKIQRSKALGACPVLFIKKQDGSLRLCIDYRELNAVTKTIRSSLPLIKDIFDAIGREKSSLYTKMDLKGAFNLLRIQEGKEHLTAFQTKFGLFEYKVIPFGLKNAPSHFQSVMNSIFSDLIGNGLVVYIDDLLIYTKDPIRHRELVTLVLERLQAHGFIVSLSKCRFEQPEVEFLGHMVSQAGLRMIGDKVSAVKAFPDPRNLKQLQSWLGLTNYYRAFIPKYSELTLPLVSLLKKDAPFIWSGVCRKAMSKMKEEFSDGRVLRHPDQSAAFYLECDASDFAIGGALHQLDQETGLLRPVGFFNRKFTPAEINYPIYDKELLAIKDGLLHWRHLLVDADPPVTVFSDHRNLTFFKSSQKLSRRQARWQEVLADFNFRIQYRPGPEMFVADALSRDPSLSTSHGDPEREVNVAVLLPPNRFQEEPREVRHILTDETIEGDPFDLSTLVDPALEEPGDEADVSRNPERADLTNWPALMFIFLKTRRIDDRVAPKYKRLLKAQQGSFWIHQNSLYRKWFKKGQSHAALYVPKALRERRMKAHHEILGHLATPSTLEAFKVRFWWPRLDQDFKDFVGKCHVCQLNRSDRTHPVAPLQPTPPTGIPFLRWGIDHIQSLPRSDSGNTDIITATCYTTRFLVAKAVPDRGAGHVAQFIFELMMKFGAPSEIVTDRGSAFNAAVLKDYLALQDVCHLPSTPYHPQTNGVDERMHRVLKPILTKMMCGAKTKWDVFLPSAVFICNARKQTVTGFSPFYLSYGFEPRLPSDIHPPVAFNLSKEQDRLMFTERELIRLGQDRAAALYRSQQQAHRMKANFASRNSPSDDFFEPGTFVKLKNNAKTVFDFSHHGPFIVERLGASPHTYYLKSPSGVELKNPVNQANLELYRTRADGPPVAVPEAAHDVQNSG